MITLQAKLMAMRYLVTGFALAVSLITDKKYFESWQIS